MNNATSAMRQRDESPSAAAPSFGDTHSVFQLLFERSADAIWLYNPQKRVMVDCNQAAVELSGAENKQQLLQLSPEDLSPPVQLDGTLTRERTLEITALVEKNRGYRFEWLMQRRDGRVVPLEVSSTPIV